MVLSSVAVSLSVLGYNCDPDPEYLLASIRVPKADRVAQPFYESMLVLAHERYCISLVD
jgi:hypothetical protein